jgi:hypothetical protein
VKKPVQPPRGNWSLWTTRPERKVPEASVGPETPNPEAPNPEAPNPEAPNPEAPNPETPESGPWKLPTRLLASILGLAVLVTLAQTPAGRSVLRLTGLEQPPTAYSALYFTDPSGLPTTLPSGHVALNVSFTVHNASQHANGYRWTVQLVQGKKTQSAASGTLTIPAGGTQAENRPVAALCPSGVLEVVVRLAAPAESIHFTAACGG